MCIIFKHNFPDIRVPLLLPLRFAYQQLKGWRPILSAHNAEIFFLAVGTLLIGLGIPILIAALGVKEYSVRYDNAGQMAGLTSEQQQQAIWNASDSGIVYNVNINVEERMEPPVRCNRRFSFPSIIFPTYFAYRFIAQASLIFSLFFNYLTTI